MEYLTEDLWNYATQVSSPEPELLRQLYRETHLKTLYPRMLSGPIQGRIISMLSQIIRPRRILEIGTFTGYSCICLSEGLAPSGEIHSIELDAELAFLIEPHLEKAGIRNQVHLHFGRAAQILPTLEGPFDMVFIDADKAGYLTYYQQVFDMVSSGGIILADNVLWDGKVIDPDVMDKETKGIREFNAFVEKDSRVSKVLLPIRDGLFLIRKK